MLVDGLSGPAGLTTADGALYVADNLAGTLHRIRDGGSDLVVEGLDQPEGLAAANRSIYVVEAGNGRVTAINPANGESVTVAGPLERRTVDERKGIVIRCMVGRGHNVVERTWY